MVHRWLSPRTTPPLGASSLLRHSEAAGQAHGRAVGAGGRSGYAAATNRAVKWHKCLSEALGVQFGKNAPQTSHERDSQNATGIHALLLYAKISNITPSHVPQYCITFLNHSHYSPTSPPPPQPPPPPQYPNPVATCVHPIRAHPIRASCMPKLFLKSTK